MADSLLRFLFDQAPVRGECVSLDNTWLEVLDRHDYPPVLQSIVAEIYGPDENQRLALAREVRGIMERAEGVVDIDWYVEADQPKIRFVVDRVKAALHGVSEASIARSMAGHTARCRSGAVAG